MIKKFQSLGIFIFLMSFIFAGALVSKAQAFSNKSDFYIPVDRDGFIAENVQQVGVFPLMLRNTTGTAIVLGSSIAIYGVMTSSIAAGDSVDQWQFFLNLRSTDTPNITSQLLIPPILFSTLSAYGLSVNTIKVFNPPIVCPYGLSADISSITLSVNATTGMAQAAIFYRFLDTGTDERTWIPIDKNDYKSRSASLYGVVPSSINSQGGTEFMVGGDTNTSEVRLLYGVCYGTGTLASYALFEDTNAVTGNSLTSLPPLFYRTQDYFNRQPIGNDISGCYNFPWPIIHVIGLTVKRSPGTDMFSTLSRPAKKLR